ncbi:ATP-binding cassette domain-containing protein [Bifidobacterium pseudolongum]|uniref:ATP-binding cassette domain-containing protein n=1 Tax=Bifidobacterium pseudolongum TaxID=1694 RepID=A0A4S4F7U7_9BIFI|nr:ATP-binding cassette domain-containing protein [Bifidobacterium pseudolongum]THG25919.1 ATP-binding cassette domain-containing protein [Bifidobacterium pseudolongum]
MSPNPTPPAPHLFEATHVTAVMPQQGGSHTVFHDLSFHVDAREVVDITGPSGAGKSTLLTAFARLNAHTTGIFTLDGKDSDSFTPQQWRVRVSYLPQTSTLIGDTVADVIRLPWTLAVRQGERKQEPADMLADAHIRQLLDAMGCADIQLDRNPRDLSGGQAARVSLARTILTKPRVLLADEVDAGLDEENADKVADLLKRAAGQGAGVVRIRHRAPDGRASRIMVLSDGELNEQQAPAPANTAAAAEREGRRA